MLYECKSCETSLPSQVSVYHDTPHGVCVCVFCVVMLPSMVLHKSTVQPYQRGFYCADDSIRYAYKSSTVPSSVLTAVGLLLPIASVSAPQRGLRRGTWGQASGATAWEMKSFERVIIVYNLGETASA